MALFLSMIGLGHSKPMGFEYPSAKVPIIEGPTMSTTSFKAPATPDCDICPPDEAYDDYDPNDIPLDQAAPSDKLPGYKYPVPENPLILPSKRTPTTSPLPLPDCVLSNELNQGYLEAGVPLCPEEYDDYDSDDIPDDQAMPKPGCIPGDLKDSGMYPEYLMAGVPLCPSENPTDYKYPSPDNPLNLPPKTIPTTAAPIYDDYDPNDIPADQSEPKGYEYPVPQIPFTLPSKSTTPKTTTTLPLLSIPECVPGNHKNMGQNSQFLATGVPVCPSVSLPNHQPTSSPPTYDYDDYDP